MLKRTAFYCLALFTACLQCFFGFLASFIDGRSPLLYVFGKIAGVFSVVTVVWIGVLLRYNNKPFSVHFLTRANVHMTSFVVLSIVWSAIGIMLATQAPYECDAKTFWCAAASFSTTLAFLSSAFSGIAVVSIYHSSKALEASFSANVAGLGARASIYSAYSA